MINHYGEYIVYDMPKSNDLQTTNYTHYMYMYQCISIERFWVFFHFDIFYQLMTLTLS
jgi:hypothetical protein